MINIFIAILALAVGLFVGSIVFGRETELAVTKPSVKVYHPVVDSFIFRNQLTKHKLVEDVLHNECYKFMSHFDVPNPLKILASKQYEASLDQLADAIMQWWNPEYNELLLVAHRESASGFVVDWTWKKPSHGAVDELGR